MRCVLVCLVRDKKKNENLIGDIVFMNIPLTSFFHSGKKRFLFIIVILATLTQIATDVYVPSMPAIMRTLETTESLVQLTMASFTLGFAIAALFYGVLSDLMGRRKSILSGMLVGIMGTLLCAFAPSISILILGRFVQGLGMSAASVGSRAILRDLFEGNQLAKLGSYLGMLFAVVTAAAPSLGGYIQYYFFWRANFIFILILSVSVWLTIYFLLPETRRLVTQIRFSHFIHSYLTLIKHKSFLSYAACSAIAYGGLLAYLSVGPFLFEDLVGLNAVQFGWLAFLLSGAMCFAAWINTKYVVKFGIPKMITLGSAAMTIAGALLMFLALYGAVNTVAIIVPVMIFVGGCGLTFANAFAGAITPFPEIAGASGALFGSVQVLGGSLGSMLIALFHGNNQLALGIVFSMFGVLIALIMTRLMYAERKGHP